jgi:hypothetical protein
MVTVLQVSRVEGPVALLCNFAKNEDASAGLYNQWLRQDLCINLLMNGGRRLLGGSCDPGVHFHGVRIDDVVCEWFPSGELASRWLEFLRQSRGEWRQGLGAGCPARGVVFAFRPAKVELLFVMKWLGPLLYKLWGIYSTFNRPLKETFVNANLADPKKSKWMDAEDLDIGIQQGLSKMAVMYNLNKFCKVADYSKVPEKAPSSQLSGRKAYGLYGSPLGMLRRGNRPFFIGESMGLVTDVPLDEKMAAALDDAWDELIFVRYRTRDSFFAMVSDQSYADRAYHREAALERAFVKLLQPWYVEGRWQAGAWSKL